MSVRTRRLSNELEDWLRSDAPTTVGSLAEVFGTRSFALLFVVAMAFPALPLPTGGLSHALELVTMVLAAELVVGRREVWIPRRWRDRELRVLSEDGRFATSLLRKIRWVERRSHPRFARVLASRPVERVAGGVVLGLSVAAFLAPPFSGLDTLPAMGVVGLGLGMLLRDVVVAVGGVAVGAVGVALILGVGHVLRTMVW